MPKAVTQSQSSLLAHFKKKPVKPKRGRKSKVKRGPKPKPKPESKLAVPRSSIKKKKRAKKKTTGKEKGMHAVQSRTDLCSSENQELLRDVAQQ